MTLCKMNKKGAAALVGSTVLLLALAIGLASNKKDGNASAANSVITLSDCLAEKEQAIDVQDHAAINVQALADELEATMESPTFFPTRMEPYDRDVRGSSANKDNKLNVDAGELKVNRLNFKVEDDIVRV